MITELQKNDIFAKIAVHDSAVSVSKVCNSCVNNEMSTGTLSSFLIYSQRLLLWSNKARVEFRLLIHKFQTLDTEMAES